MRDTVVELELTRSHGRDPRCGIASRELARCWKPAEASAACRELAPMATAKIHDEEWVWCRCTLSTMSQTGGHESEGEDDLPSPQRRDQGDGKDREPNDRDDTRHDRKIGVAFSA